MLVLGLFFCNQLEGGDWKLSPKTSGENKSDSFKLCKVSVCPSSQPVSCCSSSPSTFVLSARALILLKYK